MAADAPVVDTFQSFLSQDYLGKTQAQIELIDLSQFQSFLSQDYLGKEMGFDTNLTERNGFQSFLSQDYLGKLHVKYVKYVKYVFQSFLSQDYLGKCIQLLAVMSPLGSSFNPSYHRITSGRAERVLRQALEQKGFNPSYHRITSGSRRDG